MYSGLIRMQDSAAPGLSGLYLATMSVELNG